ncbi:MAG: prepilin-type N-terminal cleavage/methylation domain-containing protein [Bdellovibrionales bacterium]|nr:prepilin-type N-terminal cleavage/methylation domain-containing protein [Bdellovibrionales bacterium]
MSEESGFTLVEVVVVTVLIAILAAIAIPNFAQFKNRSYQAVVRSDYAHLKMALEAQADDPEVGLGNFIMANQIGPKVLPAPLDKVSLSPEVRLQTALKIELLGFLSVTLVQLSHEKLTETYRFLEINGVRTEQVF